MRILIVPDKFKGTLTASAAAEAMARGWREARPQDVLDLLPMSDGGDGFGEVLAALIGAERRVCQTVDAAHRPCAAPWWWDPATRTALIESARVIGLALLPPKVFHPFDLDTSGLAAVLRAAAEAGSARCLMGIGGSATNDGGFGMARALGWRFMDRSGEAIDRWTRLDTLARIERPSSPLSLPELMVAVDVQNVLLGPSGATRVYGPQKGVRPEDFARAEACLGRLAEVAKESLGSDADAQPGSGAAGGLGFGLRCFLDARLESGFDLFSRHARLEERIRNADLVVTGEGAIDPSTMMGKGVGEVARLSRQFNVPCIGLAGTLVMPAAEQAPEPFTEIHGIAPSLTSAEEAMRNPERWLTRLAATAARARP